jgi:ABC-type transport system involved in multi-copper enzyme maturation permease subunit
MTWLALRLLRPYLVVAGIVTALATGYLLYAARVVQDQLDLAGTPDCLDPNLCYPHSAALDAVLGMELVAAFVPPLIALIIGVPLFAREREDETAGFVLTQSVSRQRWVLTKLGWALTFGVVCSTIVGATHRLIGARYTVLANDTYEMLQMLHLNNIAFKATLTAVLISLAALLGLGLGRTLPTLVLSAIAWPFTVMAGFPAADLFSAVYIALLGAPEQPFTGTGNFADDISFMDPLAYLNSAVYVIAVVALVLLARRAAARAAL